MYPDPLGRPVPVLVADSLRLDDLTVLHALLEQVSVVPAVLLLRAVQVCQPERAEHFHGARQHAPRRVSPREPVRLPPQQELRVGPQFGASPRDYRAGPRAAADTSVSPQTEQEREEEQILRRLAVA